MVHENETVESFASDLKYSFALPLSGGDNCSLTSSSILMENIPLDRDLNFFRGSEDPIVGTFYEHTHFCGRNYPKADTFYELDGFGVQMDPDLRDSHHSEHAPRDSTTHITPLDEGLP